MGRQKDKLNRAEQEVTVTYADLRLIQRNGDSCRQETLNDSERSLTNKTVNTRVSHCKIYSRASFSKLRCLTSQEVSSLQEKLATNDRSS